MSVLNLKNTEGKLKTKDGEILNYRIYSDGGAKIESLNMKEDFISLFGANDYNKSKQYQNYKLEMRTAVYFNQAKNETYELGGIANMQQAYDLYKFVCSRNNWNPAMFTNDVIVKLK